LKEDKHAYFKSLLSSQISLRQSLSRVELAIILRESIDRLNGKDHIRDHIVAKLLGSVLDEDTQFRVFESIIPPMSVVEKLNTSNCNFLFKR